jgi:hypothetical protein
LRFWAGVTDNQWFIFLSETRPEEVIFWQPIATPPFTNAPIGLPFLFKFKHPFNHIAGGSCHCGGKKMKSLLTTAEYRTFLKEIKELIHKARYDALKAVNKELINLYWDIGKSDCLLF